MVVLGGGCFLMSEVPLYWTRLGAKNATSRFPDELLSNDRICVFPESDVSLRAAVPPLLLLYYSQA